MKTLLKKFIPEALIDTFWHFPRAICAAIFFGFPARHLTCIAIAGTKGKTSTAYFLHDILQQSGLPTALFSTAGGKIKSDEFLNIWKMTTPSPFALQKFLAQAISGGCTHAVIEVSSHALQQHRTWGIPFTVALITNLLPDHLEYHASAKEYSHIHQRLLSPSTRMLLIDGADTHSAFFGKDPRTLSFSSEKSGTDRIQSLPQWWAPLQKPNLIAACAGAHALGVSDSAISSALTLLTPAPGRFEDINEGQDFRAIVDYAHSPESLMFFFKAIRPLVANKLIVVFGACGDRDKTTRSPMGSILEQYADTIILTTDDPYSEDSADIADQVEKGFTETTRNDRLIRILDRRDAIQKALEIAKTNDCVCILGKGAEQFQLFKNKKIPWDDRGIVRELLQKRG